MIRITLMDFADDAQNGNLVVDVESAQVTGNLLRDDDDNVIAALRFGDTWMTDDGRCFSDFTMESLPY